MRNKMHSFAATPQANIPRSRFDMPCNVKFTGNTGKLIPFYVCEVLPGDTFDVSTSIVCRLQTLIHPIMDNIYLDTYYFFVPNRLVWDNWQHFCGEPNKAWVADRDYTVPYHALSWDPDEYTGTTSQKVSQFMTECFKDSIVDYMGVGISPNVGIGEVHINSLPIRGYNKIFDDWYRDENLIDPINLYTGDNNQTVVTKANWADPLRGGACYDAPKLHDYFTSALPQAQRGNPVELVFGDSTAPVITMATDHSIGSRPIRGVNVVGNTENVNAKITSSSQPGSTSGTGVNAQLVNYNYTNTTGFYPANLYATLNGVSSGINVNDLRMAFQVQKWLERSARGGARYIELLKSMFGVTSPDARLQRSEYLGGHRVPINIHQIVNTSETVDTPLGNTGAMSVTSDVHNDFIHSFVEHGFVIGIMTIRYKHSYPQGFDRMWFRRTKFDYYWPVFANIGEQPVRNQEIYWSGNHTTGEQVFGYQEAWADYRYKPNRVMGEMRPGVPNSLASWTLSDYYTSQPVLSGEWIKEDKMQVDRAIAVTSAVADQWLFDVLINNKATRPMPLYSIPGLVDHF